MDKLRELLSGYSGTAILVVVVAVIVKYGSRGLAAFRFYRNVKQEFSESQAQRLATRQEERDAAIAALAEVERDLRQSKRDLERREDFSRQDRAHIRLLKVRIKELHGDYDDVDEQILNFFESEKREKA